MDITTALWGCIIMMSNSTVGVIYELIEIQRFCSNRLEVCMCARMTSSIHVSDGVIYASMKYPDGKINIRADQCSVGKIPQRHLTRLDARVCGCVGVCLYARPHCSRGNGVGVLYASIAYPMHRCYRAFSTCRGDSYELISQEMEVQSVD